MTNRERAAVLRRAAELVEQEWPPVREIIVAWGRLWVSKKVNEGIERPEVVAVLRDAAAELEGDDGE